MNSRAFENGPRELEDLTAAAAQASFEWPPSHYILRIDLSTCPRGSNATSEPHVLKNGDIFLPSVRMRYVAISLVPLSSNSALSAFVEHHYFNESKEVKLLGDQKRARLNPLVDLRR
jgi:hypothetical protein